MDFILLVLAFHRGDYRVGPGEKIVDEGAGEQAGAV